MARIASLLLLVSLATFAYGHPQGFALREGLLQGPQHPVREGLLQGPQDPLGDDSFDPDDPFGDDYDDAQGAITLFGDDYPCTCINPFSGYNAHKGDIETLCLKNNVCYVECNGGCSDQKATAGSGRCSSKLACGAAKGDLWE